MSLTTKFQHIKISNTMKANRMNTQSMYSLQIKIILWNYLANIFKLNILNLIFYKWMHSTHFERTRN